MALQLNCDQLHSVEAIDQDKTATENTMHSKQTQVGQGDGRKGQDLRHFQSLIGHESHDGSSVQADSDCMASVWIRPSS